ncbi:MAG: hypothetical protein HY820_08985 [Acidobacteria bacterium]|nr:hypothetical protein [Acidobacteriota bacterium]
MSDFRKLLLAFAAVTLAAGIASAQVTPPIVCSTTAQPLTVRTEGLAEQTGDVVISCTGGQIPTVGSALPQVNISVTLSTNITSRLLNDPITEALLFVDDPQPGSQNPCAPASGSTVCSPLTAGAGGTALDASGINRNVFQGVRQSDNTIVWLAVPINAPGTSATRLFRTKNIRAAIAGASAANGQIFAYVSIQNPPANLQLNQSSVNVAFVQQGLLFALRSLSGGGFSSTTQNRTFLFQCDNINRNLAASNTAVYDGSPSAYNGRNFEARFREAYAASWKVRDINPALQEPGNQQNLPQLNNGAPQTGTGTVVESGFFNTGFTAVNGLNRAGRADHGTRLRVAFNNVPANIRIYVSTHSLSNATSATADSKTSGGGETTAYTAAFGVATDSTGRNVAAGTVLSNPTSSAEVWNAANTLPGIFPSGAIGGAIEVPLTGGSGSFTWEVFAQDPNQIDTASFAVAVAFRPTNNPGLGTIAVNGSFAPLGGGNTMSASASLPRFADQSTAINSASTNACVTHLLFPFTTNQAGFDTGLAIANTSADPYGTSPQSGNCTLNYYGSTTGGGAAPAANTTTTPIAGGETLVGTLSSGGSNGLKATPGFQGYIIAVCNFRYAHGFAFVSDVGSQKLAEGYLALILDPRPGITGEALNN